MNVYFVLSETMLHYDNVYPPENPPEPYSDVAMVAALTRGQARYLTWKNVHSEGYSLAEYTCSAKKVGTIEKDEPGVLTDDEATEYWGFT